jgi:cell fate regulator YaaT (PSP1 superfamily)
VSAVPSAEPTTRAERWGDDRDAPTPEVKLAPDLPENEVDEDGEPLFEVDEDHDWPAGQLANVAAIKFHPAGKLYEMDAGDGSFAVGDPIIVETDRGVQQAILAIAPTRRLVREPLRRILRRADARDLQAAERNVRRGEECLHYARERVHERRMPIKMFKVEILPGGSKALFYFSSEDRIDFRELVRDLTSRFHMRVEMRQTGVRDEAKLVGGIGSCGRELCCSTFLPRFEPVSIKMAKDQGLVLNPSKVSGQCGRLKCCLVYEEATYREMRKGLPKLGKRVATPAGEGRVAEVDVLRQRIRVAFEGDFQTFPASAVSPIAPIQPGATPLPPVVPPEEED